MAPTLGYWHIRGLGQPIRLLLEYVGTEFEDKLYDCGPAPDYDKSCWLNEKFSLGLSFPNLPYWIDGDIKLTQSNAIIRHIGRQHKLLGETDEEQRRVDLMMLQVTDIRGSLGALCYSPDFESKRGAYVENLPTVLKLVSEFLGERKWFAGDKVTIADFPVYEYLDQLKHLQPDCLNNFENLQKFVERFEALEPIQKYMKSSRFIKYPINNKVAKFGGN